MGITQFASQNANLEGDLTSLGIRIVAVSAVALIVLLLISAKVKDRFPATRLPLFGLITAVIGLSTVYLFASTVYLNVVSDSGGPVHWHADIEYWACDTEVELRDPYKFLSNKIGSPVLHEHDDKRIHLEGVVVDLDEDATIGHFMETIGGALDDTRIAIPVHDDRIVEDDVDGDSVSETHLAQLETYITAGLDDGRLLELSNGQTCGDQPAEVQVFAYQYNQDDKTYQQHKLQPGTLISQQVKAGEYADVILRSAKDYIYSDYSNVPAGDCIIFEFDVPKAATDRLCNQYGLKDSQRCVEFGVSEFNPDLCDITDVTDYERLNRDFQTAPTASSTLPDDNDIYCAPYFFANGAPTGVITPSYKSNGTLVDVTRDCESYRLDLLCDYLSTAFPTQGITAECATHRGVI